MAQFADIVVNPVNVVLNLGIGKVFVQDFVRSHNYFLADLEAKLAAGYAVLGGKPENHVHDQNSGKERKRFEDKPQCFFDK